VDCGDGTGYRPYFNGLKAAIGQSQGGTDSRAEPAQPVRSEAPMRLNTMRSTKPVDPRARRLRVQSALEHLRLLQSRLQEKPTGTLSRGYAAAGATAERLAERMQQAIESYSE
jgi:hypothetical protein